MRAISVIIQCLELLFLLLFLALIVLILVRVAVKRYDPKKLLKSFQKFRAKIIRDEQFELIPGVDEAIESLTRGRMPKNLRDYRVEKKSKILLDGDAMHKKTSYKITGLIDRTEEEDN